MIKNRLQADLEEVLNQLGWKIDDLVLSISQKPEFGDYSSNIPLQLAKQNLKKSNQSPLEIANQLLDKLKDLDYLEKVEVAGNGFLNFFVKSSELVSDLTEILDQKENYGKSNLGQGKKWQVEYISANPTGPLTLANGRGGAMGDSLSNVLGFSGFEVEREYYINDTGNQVRLLGESVKARAGLTPPAQNHYQGQYINDLVELAKENSWLELDSQDLGHNLADFLVENDAKPALNRFGIQFDHFFSERTLHQQEAIEAVVGRLREAGTVYENDGALWFKGTEYGDSADRVIITSKVARGQADPTYFLIDVAYHLNVFDRGFDKKINIWGADHHGYLPRVQAALKALGFEGRLEVILIQFVKLLKEGKEVRMSKRAGNFVTLNELLDEVSPDVARFFFLMYAPTSHINFNLDLAKEKSEKNPVFYVQYAHARMSGILEKSEKDQVKSQELGDWNPEAVELELIKHLLEFPGLVEGITRTYMVHHLTEYAINLADKFHKFYENCRVLNAETEELKTARLNLVEASKITLGNSLQLLGVSAPEKM